jgi:toxin-antitoxin system PIN domain toxin
MRALLDVNVLVALLDQQHVHHRRARNWLEGESTAGWASCAITQNGFVRIISRPGYPNPITAKAAIDLLNTATRTEYHQFWPCSVSLLDPDAVDASRIHSHRQVTDAYLLALAANAGGRFVTFDQSISLSAVHGASTHQLVVL